MQNSRYKSPWGNHTRALERNIIKYRSMEMTLVVYYAEVLRNFIIKSMQTLDNFDRQLNKNNPKPRLKASDKNLYFASLKIWEKEGLISKEEKKELIELTDYRNDIAHRINQINADLSNDKYVSDLIRTVPDHYSSYQHKACNKLRQYVKDIPERFYQKHHVGYFDGQHGMFETTEKTLTSELKSLRLKIDRLYRKRRVETDALNEENRIIHERFTEEKSPNWVFQTYDDGRFTPRGEEICYRLFDDGFSDLVIAYSFGLLLPSIKRRRKMWRNIGGLKRPKIVYEDLPIRRSPIRYEY